jgi:hypothetical protein
LFFNYFYFWIYVNHQCQAGFIFILQIIFFPPPFLPAIAAVVAALPTDHPMAAQLADSPQSQHQHKPLRVREERERERDAQPVFLLLQAKYRSSLATSTPPSETNAIN